MAAKKERAVQLLVMIWTTAETERVADWLSSPSVYPGFEKIVHAWNDSELLGIDLADEIESLARSNQKGSSDLDLSKVDWNELAEHYAQEICGVDEDELIRRRRNF